MNSVISSAIAAGGPLGVIASMITPAFMILSAANLIGSTLVRLGRSVDRARVVTEQMHGVQQTGNTAALPALQARLRRYGLRGTLVQLALSAYYLAIGCFVAASLAIAMAHFSAHSDSWLPTWITVAGAVLLFCGTVLLFTETTLATAMLRREIAEALEGA